jgi:hypothetical protein
MVTMHAVLVSAVAIALAGTGHALAKPAQCFTTDEGHYPCDFRATDKAGSFIIRADGYPTFTIEIDSPGVAFVFADFGNRNVALPGPYHRAEDDRACWVHPDAGSRLCVW